VETTPEIDYGAILAALKKKRDDLDKAIFGVEQLLGLPSGGDTPTATATVTPTNGASRETLIRADTFFGMNIASAAQKYLEMQKKPASPVEIATALTAGGMPSQSNRLHNTVNSILNRNSRSSSPIFAKVKRGMWGLRVWYPNYREAKPED
jgi:hypothetical protein